VKPRYFWIGLVIALLSLSVGVHAVLLIASINDPSFGVEPDYEQKARNYDQIQRQREASRALGWMADLTTLPADAGEVGVSVNLFDRYGKPLREAEVSLETFHVARSGHWVRGQLEPAGDGVYAATLPLRRSGLWEFRLRVVLGDDVFTETIRKSVLSTPRNRTP